MEVTERVRAEERVRHEYGMRVTLLDNIPDCFALILKKHTREIVASNKLAKVNGATPDKKCYEVFAKRDDPCPFCMAPTLWATGEPQKAEVAYRGRYFRGIWVPFTADIYIHYIFDITERKRAEMEPKKLIADL